jgi:hypothetical protein
MSNKNAKLSLQALVVIGALGALAGCGKDEASGIGPSGLGASGSSAPREAIMAAMAPAPRPPGQADTLAYEHTVSIETTRELLPKRMQELEAACNADRASGCTVLDVTLHSQNDLPNGGIRMRLAPAGVEPMVALASKDGEVSARSTHAEDLAEPIADAERQLALMTLHRDRLTEFMRSKELKVDQLITVSKELATVQSQIDSLSTQRANLRRRVDTDLLTINLTLPVQEYSASGSPIADALQSFGSDFREAVGMVIRFLAVLLPWLVVVLPGLFLLRLFWRWIGRRLARRELRA